MGLLAVGLALTPLAAGAKSEGPEHPTEAAARARPLPMHQRERELIDIFQTARTAYLSRKPPKLSAKDARVGLQVGVIGFMQHGQTATDWVGQLISRRTTREGAMRLEVQIAPGIVIVTRQSEVADGNEQTLLSRFSPLHDKAENAELGVPIIFSAQILESPLASDEEMIMRPKLIARFTDLKSAE